MMHGFRCLRILVLIAVVPLGGCLFRSRPVALRTSTAPLQTATRDELIERINSEASEIQTLKATVGITASVGGSKRGKITEYQEIRGFILARKPSSLRRRRAGQSVPAAKASTSVASKATEVKAESRSRTTDRTL